MARFSVTKIEDWKTVFALALKYWLRVLALIVIGGMTVSGYTCSYKGVSCQKTSIGDQFKEGEDVPSR